MKILGLVVGIAALPSATGIRSSRNKFSMISRAITNSIRSAGFVVVFALGCKGSAFATVFSAGDETTYGEAEWGSNLGSAQNLLLTDFGTVYASAGAVLDVGDLSKYYMEFDSGSAVHAFLPQNGPVGVLNTVLLDPVSSASGAFGGDVVALKLNVDFSSAGFLPNSLGIPFGGLILGGFGNSLDGLSVNSFLADANTCLGGETCLLSVADMDAIAFQLNASFDSGTPDAWANDHLGPELVTAVPEPASLAMFGVGLAALGLMRRKRKAS